MARLPALRPARLAVGPGGSWSPNRRTLKIFPHLRKPTGFPVADTLAKLPSAEDGANELRRGFAIRTTANPYHLKAEDGRGGLTDIDSMWRRASVPAVLELLRRGNSQAKALKIARLELHRARRARSRKRFDFWSAVSTELESGLSGKEMPGRGARGEQVSPGR